MQHENNEQSGAPDHNDSAAQESTETTGTDRMKNVGMEDQQEENPEGEERQLGTDEERAEGDAPFTPEAIAERFMNVQGRKSLDKSVFPSEVKSVAARNTEDGYGGAHVYQFIPCLGFHHGETRYCIETNAQNGGQSTVDLVTLQFVQKHEDGSVTPGLQTEQVIIALIDRVKKLNAKFPAPENDIIISSLQQALFYHEKRVRDRMNRGVMGDLKK